MTARITRITGLILIAAGLGVLGWLGWQLWGTSAETQAAQSDLMEEWLAQVGDGATLAGAEDFSATGRPAEPIPEGSVFALLEIVRPGGDSPIPGTMAVVEGVGLDDLRKGPGHYPGSADPGSDGNLAIAGHRTTYGAPFGDLDQIEPGDELHVTDRGGDRHVYRVVEQRVVRPDDFWVLAANPLGSGKPMITLTTCHPRFSNRQRLVVFGELVDAG